MGPVAKLSKLVLTRTVPAGFVLVVVGVLVVPVLVAVGFGVLVAVGLLVGVGLLLVAVGAGVMDVVGAPWNAVPSLSQPSAVSAFTAAALTANR
jgi:hypothetical protein